MAKIQNIFKSGLVNLDDDERFVPEDQMVQAINFLVTTSDGSNGGVGKNVASNIKKTNYNILGAKTIGEGADTNLEKVYDLISGTNFDYIMEYDIPNNTSAIVLQDTKGRVLKFDSSKRIFNVDIITDSEGDGNLIVFSGDDNPPRIFNIEIAKTWGLDNFSDGDISVMKPSPIFAPDITLTTSTDGVENNFLEDKFLVFGYRYKYADNFYSAPSSWTRIAFEPSAFKLDYQTYENNGMLNLSNAVDVTFKTGPRDVTEIDLLFRESNSSIIYVIQNFVKADEGWANDVPQTFQISKSKIYTVLSEEQYFRNFDNVPLKSIAQTIIGNRIAYSNYIEGRDLGVIIDFAVEVVSTNPVIDQTDGVVANVIDITSYSNVVDFVEGFVDAGSSPVDQMNYEDNQVEIDFIGGSNLAEFGLQIMPKPEYLTVPYNVYFKEGNTILQSAIGITGNQTIGYFSTSERNVKMYVTSSLGLIYDSRLDYNLINTPSTDISRYDYFGYNQLSYPNSTTYPITSQGDTIIEYIAGYDTTGFSFLSGNQIRINMELKSSLVANFNPSVTFFYNITQDFSSLSDFLANSSFITQLETVFSLTFRNNELSNAGTIVSYEGFMVSSSGNTLYVKMPKVVYTVTEPSGAILDKNEFYLITETDLIITSENAYSSMHSNRDYEVALIYMDEQGRKTTALNCKTNSVYIPADNSDTVNKLEVTINNAPPSWARYYKFAIKQTKRNYETIYGNQVYTEGIYRWIKLVGENKNKVQEGDLLIVKTDYSGPLETLVKVKVIEIKDQQANFIAGNELSSGQELIEEDGLYFKIKQDNFDINITDESFRSYIGRGKRRYASRSFVTTKPLFGEFDSVSNDFIPTEIKAGTQIRFFAEQMAFGQIAFNNSFENIAVAQTDYTDMKAWFDAEIAILGTWTTFAGNNFSDWEFQIDVPSGFSKAFRVKPNRDGTATRDIITTIVFDVNFAGGTLVFETEPLEQLTSSYFETPETFTITDGSHQFMTHLLNDAFNCFSFGNGVESYKIQDGFTKPGFSIDSNPTAINKEGYREIKRFSDITYSGVYNSNTNINRLNEFNLSLANYKDDLEKKYGPVYKLKGQDTNLEVYQEDKDSVVYYGKDLLFNADGTTNLSRIEEVLGQQRTYEGEYGISMHPDSFDDYGFDCYHTDVKRGVVIKKSNNGLFEASSQKMRSYFKNLFRNNTITYINGKYDQYNDFYILNIQFNEVEFVTWVYSDKNNGWLGRLNFNPESMLRVNNHFISFKNGEIWMHNQENVRNTFYGVESDSIFSFNFSQEPSTRKSFKNIEVEGTIAPDVELLTELNQGYINKADFERKEGDIFYAYVRNNNEVIDTALLSSQGIGNCTITGLVLNFGFELDSVISVGDNVYNQNLELVGTILSKTANSLTLNAVDNIVDGDYVLCQKPQSIQNNDLLGRYMKVTCRFSSNTLQEIFAVNSVVSKSFV